MKGRTGKEGETEKEKGRERNKKREDIFFYHTGMKLELNHRKKNGKRTNTCRLNNMLLKSQ